MTTSQKTFSLSKPTGDSRLPIQAVAYFQARNRNNAFECILREFQASGLSQATIARRLGKRPEVISRLLGSPGNWTLDTVSDLLFAISGAELSYTLCYPLDEPARNDTRPEWLDERVPSKRLDDAPSVRRRPGATSVMEANDARAVEPHLIDQHAAHRLEKVGQSASKNMMEQDRLSIDSHRMLRGARP